MRKNMTKGKIKAGKIAYGVFVNMGCPTIIEIIGLIGFDFAVIDAEHGPMDIETCEHMVRASDNVNITPIIRVAVNIRQNILRYLDIGALGVHIPMVSTKAEAESVVQAIKYPPEGRRGLAGVRAANYGLTDSLGDYVKEANHETLVIVAVETMQAVDNLKDILSVPGVDIIFIGPTDLSSAMGYPGQVTHPEVQKMIGNLVKEIRAVGKAAGTVAYNLDALKKCQERGFQYIAYGVGPMLTRSGREYLEAARQ